MPSTSSTRRSCGLGAADAPVPYNPDLERASVPQVETIETAARRLARREV